MTNQENQQENNSEVDQQELLLKEQCKISEEELKQILAEIQLEADALPDDEELTPVWTDEQKDELNQNTSRAVNKLDKIADYVGTEEFKSDEEAKIKLTWFLYEMQAAHVELNRTALRRNLKKIKTTLSPEEELQTRRSIEFLTGRLVDALQTCRTRIAFSRHERGDKIKKIDDLTPELINLTEQAINHNVDVSGFDSLFNEFTRLKTNHTSNLNEEIIDIEYDIFKLNKILTGFINFIDVVSEKIKNLSS